MSRGNRRIVPISYHKVFGGIPENYVFKTMIF
jgi:hypothetical protein